MVDKWPYRPKSKSKVVKPETLFHSLQRRIAKDIEQFKASERGRYYERK